MAFPHLYPDVSDPHPTFMLGQFDLDDPDRGPVHMLGEAMLRFQKQDGPSIAATTIRRQVSRAGEGSSAFLFGLLAEGPLVTPPDDLLLNLWATEQA